MSERGAGRDRSLTEVDARTRAQLQDANASRMSGNGAPPAGWHEMLKMAAERDHSTTATTTLARAVEAGRRGAFWGRDVRMGRTVHSAAQPQCRRMRR